MRKTKKEIAEIVINTVAELGVFIDYDGINDFDMSMYFEDSLSFINIIVALEEALEMIFPDELLMIEIYSSFDRVISIICENLS